ncbi:hypothetical protein B0H21DRAFT_857827 [Amylocystis lapponica]|nr:hypothetical protein B0H21DRAFT_857827 [Amylocystis lapponica]
MLASEASKPEGTHPVLNVPLREQPVLKARFESQFRAYAAGHYPFTIALEQDQLVLDWWRQLEKSPQADVLAPLAIKIFSVVPNSMADERTASTFTWINRPLRSRQHLDTMVSQTQIRQYYRTAGKEKGSSAKAL